MRDLEIKKYHIDFFEFAFLVEACIPPNPIARAMFWKSVIDEYYFIMTEGERERLWGWINKNDIYKERLIEENEDCLLFEARFNPDNQFLIEAKDKNGVINTFDCFYWKNEYHTKSNTSIIKDAITKVKNK